MWVTILTGGFFDTWSGAVMLKQIVTSVCAGALLGCPLAITMIEARKRRPQNSIKAF